ncbi:MAG: hypothetical protein ACI9FN_002335 [Saprospiraceae bacterium]|jgi:hypothetical protein
MNRLLLLLLLLLTYSELGIGQGNSAEINTILLEANEQYQSGRYDEAIRTYNKALKLDETHPDALFMRAQTKYELGAFKGTKIDALKLIEANGINKRLIKLMALTEIKLDNTTAAENYTNLAIELDPYDASFHYIAGGVALDKGDKNAACESFARGSLLGYSRATRELNKICGGLSDWIDIPPVDEKEEIEEVVEVSIKEDSTSIQNEEIAEVIEIDPASVKVDPVDGSVEVPARIEEITKKEKEKEEEKEEEDTPAGLGQLPPPNIDISQDVKIDDKLTLTLTNGIGERKIETTPNIFLLSDQDGIVVIDVCVSRTGKVIDAEFNRDASTVFRSSLTSLALRKAKEFVFMPSLREELCGTIIYRLRS